MTAEKVLVNAAPITHVALCCTPSFKYCNVIHINVCEENLKVNAFSETVPVLCSIGGCNFL